MINAKEICEKWCQISTKAAKDENFKKQLKQNPKKIFEQEGLQLPKGITPKIIEDTPSEMNFIIRNAALVKTNGGGGFNSMFTSGE
ncbi:MAG: NHLP leader peptide family RiPP precursor [Chlamydiales bacterium]|nr:NHLP leader peptide family RiPP precursor [Chlamydiales bacterium]